VNKDSVRHSLGNVGKEEMIFDLRRLLREHERKILMLWQEQAASYTAKFSQKPYRCTIIRDAVNCWVGPGDVDDMTIVNAVGTLAANSRYSHDGLLRRVAAPIAGAAMKANKEGREGGGGKKATICGGGCNKLRQGDAARTRCTTVNDWPLSIEKAKQS
jgi:hypothetical protein